MKDRLNTPVRHSPVPGETTAARLNYGENPVAERRVIAHQSLRMLDFRELGTKSLNAAPQHHFLLAHLKGARTSIVALATIKACLPEVETGNASSGPGPTIPALIGRLLAIEVARPIESRG